MVKIVCFVFCDFYHNKKKKTLKSKDPDSPLVLTPFIHRWVTWTMLAVVQPLSRVRFFGTPWSVACQASLSSTVSWSLLRFMSIESVVLSNLRKGLLAKLHRTYPRGRHYLISWNWSKVYYLGILLRRETFSVLYRSGNKSALWPGRLHYL